MRFAAGWAAVLALILVALAAALEVPNYTSPVTDLDGLLSDDARSALEQKILAYRDQSQNEIAVLIIPSLEGESLEDYAHKVFNTWGVGKAKGDNGVLFLMAVGDKQARIEVGYGLEESLTDLEAGRLVRRDSPMAQSFRAGNWDEGIGAVVDGIITAIGGEYDPAPPPADDVPGFVPFIFPIFFIIWVLFILISGIRQAKKKGANWGSIFGGSGGSSDWHWGSGGSSSHSSGGGFSFGGGSSGGGGASGGW